MIPVREWKDAGSRARIEDFECYSDVPELIDFFKSEMPLREDRHMGTTQEKYLCRPGSQQWTVHPAASPERAIADSEARQLEPILVDFFKGGNGGLHLRHHGVEAPVINRSSSSVEAKEHPVPKLNLETGEHWSVQVANPLHTLKMVLSPISTGTAESGTAAPKTPTCEMEIAYGRPFPAADHNESSAHQGSTTFSHGCSKLLASGEVCADSGSSHGRLRTVNPPEGEDEEAEAVVQAATSLLSLASHESSRRPNRRRPRSDVSSGSPVESDRESDDAGRSGSVVDRDGACSSVLYRPTNKRRYKLVVDLLAETPTVW